MASRLDSAGRDLAVQILRCPILAQCLEEGGAQRPCAEVATGPGSPHHAHWVPEPWVGHLAEAPLLFVSSNPGGGSEPSTDPDDPSSSSPDEVLLDCQDGAFDEGQLPGSQMGNTSLTPTATAESLSTTGSGRRGAPVRSCLEDRSPARTTPSPRWSTAAVPARTASGRRWRPAPPGTSNAYSKPHPPVSWW